jgi:methyl-accepting chemotaxis protein
MESITQLDIPLTEKITLLTEHQLEQAIYFERAVKYGVLLPLSRLSIGEGLDENNIRQHFQKEQSRFSSLSPMMEQEFEQARSIAEIGVKKAHSSEEQQEFSSILSHLTSIEQQHKVF